MGFYFKKLRDDAVIPQRATAGSAGMDLSAAIDEPVIIMPGETKLVGCGIAVSVPYGYEVQVRSRSGLALKHGIHILNGVGTVDSDYRGEIGAILHNAGRAPFTVEPGMRVAQMVLATYASHEFEVTDDLDETSRGTSGYGSTGA